MTIFYIIMKNHSALRRTLRSSVFLSYLVVIIFIRAGNYIDFFIMRGRFCMGIDTKNGASDHNLKSINHVLSTNFYLGKLKGSEHRSK